MRIPLDHFSSVPVFALSPQTLSPEPEPSEPSSLAATIRDKMSSLTPDLSMFYSSSSAGSAPSSPVTRRRHDDTCDTGGDHSPGVSPVTSVTRPASAAAHTSLPMFTSQGPAKVSRYVSLDKLCKYLLPSFTIHEFKRFEIKV